ncbi:MAG TPA: two-component regulator propeller domain-containing protein [Puia sp.]|nr:two-component regulator propeller domain-containing protein [Puia sp.]
MRHSILIFFFFQIFLPAMGQQELNFTNFSSNNGLSSNNVNAILKDRSGYMWFATEDGLNRFDGTNFTLYNHNVLDTNSIGTNQIQTIYEDAKGNLWVGTNRTLSLYDRKRDCFHNYNIANGTAIRSICPGDSGSLWIGSYAGLIRFDPATLAAKYYTTDSIKPGSLLSNTVICVFRDSHHRLWVGTNAGLYLYQPRRDDFRRFVNSPSDPWSISDNVVRTIAEDREGGLWFGTINGGMNKLQADGSRFYRFVADKSDVHSLSSNRIYTIAPDTGTALWVGTEGGLNIFDTRTGKVQRVPTDIRNKYSLKGRAVRAIYVDKLGIYWVGAYQGGVSKFDRNLSFFNLVQYNPFDPLGLSSPKVTSFAEAGDGDIYVGTDGGGLNLFHRATGLFQHVPLGGNDKGCGLSILALEKRNDQLWIGTFQQGVYVLNTKDGHIRHFRKGTGPHDLPNDEIFCIRADRSGNVWLGTNGKGILMYDQKTDAFRHFGPVTLDGKTSKLLSDGFIRAIEEDDAGNMVVGTVGSGIVVFDPVRLTGRIFNRTNTGLPLDEAIALHIDSSGVIWAGTPSAGLCRLDCRRRKFANYSQEQGLANAVIYKILEDRAGDLWVSTNKGISCFEPGNGTFKNYTTENGLQVSSFNLGAGLKTKSGEFYFGGTEGFNYFRPDALPDNRNVPIVVFTGLKVAGHSVIPGKDAAIRENIGVAREIRVDYKQNFSVEFAALDYTTPAENRYLYRLDGLDKSWNELGASRTAALTNLYPGRYTLEVRARNSNNAWITAPARILITVRPPFWLTGYAYAAYILLAGMLLWGIRQRGIRKLKNKFALEQERLQMKQVVERERMEAERLHEFDQLKIKFLTNLSHELRTPISLIMAPIDKLQEREPDQDKQVQLGMLKRNARRLLNLVNQLLDFRKLEDHETKLNCTQGDLVSFLTEAAESFRDIAERKQIRFVCESEIGRYYTVFDRDKIERILFNLLGNAFKFTGKDGTVSLRIGGKPSGNDVWFAVSDTGIGMLPADKERVFDRFFQGSSPAGVMNQGSGIGLSITKEFVRLHGGTITAESKPGAGSVFTVCLPLERIGCKGMESRSADMPAAKAALAVRAQVAAVSPMEMLTVLLVEDNDEFRYYLKESLQSLYKIVEATDGAEGWQKALSSHPDVIVSDISMPNMDGIELSRKLKSDKRVSHIPIILLTALTEGAYQLKGLETGASDYLTKPFHFEILNIKIRNLVLLNQRLKETYSRRLNIETPPAQVESDDEKLVLNVTQFIEANLDNAQLSVEELCKHVYMSHASLYRKIVDLTGETPVEFIRSVKLNKAADLLERSNMKIAEIGYAAGFTTPNYFTRAFKAKFNLSPSEYASLKRRRIG